MKDEREREKKRMKCESERMKKKANIHFNIQQRWGRRCL